MAHSWPKRRFDSRLNHAEGGLVLYAQLPVHGHYFWNLLPAFLLSGLGLAFAFVPVSIGALTGVSGDEAGVASGLLNTSQQIGVAVATTIATTFTNRSRGGRRPWSGRCGGARRVASVRARRRGGRERTAARSDVNPRLDKRHGAHFEIRPAPYLALDVYYHPYAYADLDDVYEKEDRRAA